VLYIVLDLPLAYPVTICGHRYCVKLRLLRYHYRGNKCIGYSATVTETYKIVIVTSLLLEAKIVAIAS